MLPKGVVSIGEDRALEPCPEMLAKQTEEKIQLYTAVTPPRVGDAY